MGQGIHPMSGWTEKFRRKFRLLPEAWLVPEGRDVEIRRGDGIPHGQPGVVAQGVGVGGQLGAFLGKNGTKCGKCTRWCPKDN